MEGASLHSSALHSLISYIPPWHVQQTPRKTLCVQNTNKRETAGCWQAHVLLPSPVRSPEMIETIREDRSASARTGDKRTRLQHETMKMMDAESKQVKVVELSILVLASALVQQQLFAFQTELLTEQAKHANICKSNKSVS